MQDSYCYKGTNILKNKLDLRSDKLLEEAERRLSKIREEQLLRSQILGKFDLKHLQKIHHYLFQDIYDWAGKIRTIDIAKGNLFCKVELIESQSKLIFDKLREEKYLRGLNVIPFTKRLSYYLSEINAIHPFREGNGRSEREFIRELAFQNGYFLSFRNISKNQLIDASKASFLGNYTPMENLLGSCLRPLY